MQQNDAQRKTLESLMQRVQNDEKEKNVRRGCVHCGGNVKKALAVKRKRRINE
jgi:hypothetical protein